MREAVNGTAQISYFRVAGGPRTKMHGTLSQGCGALSLEQETNRHPWPRRSRASKESKDSKDVTPPAHLCPANGQVHRQLCPQLSNNLLCYDGRGGFKGRRQSSRGLWYLDFDPRSIGSQERRQVRGHRGCELGIGCCVVGTSRHAHRLRLGQGRGRRREANDMPALEAGDDEPEREGELLTGSRDTPLRPHPAGTRTPILTIFLSDVENAQQNKSPTGKRRSPAPSSCTSPASRRPSPSARYTARRRTTT